MSDRDIEDTRMPPDEREAFTCALCEDDFDLTGLEVVINGKTICGVCSCEDADQAGYLSRALKAERKVKELQGALDPYCRCDNQKIKDNGQVRICVNCGRAPRNKA